jgi:hypothetical protein
LTLELSAAGFILGINKNVFILVLDGLAGPLSNIRWIRVREISHFAETPEDRVTSIRSLSVLLGHTNSAETLLLDSEITSACVKQVENLTELNVTPGNIFFEIENIADLTSFLLGTHRPETLKFSVVKRQAGRDGLGKQIKRCD